jgi:surfeit locus 1 family protein
LARIVDREVREDRSSSRTDAEHSPGARAPLVVTLRGVLAGVFVAAAAAVCISLGFWQMDRHQQRQHRNEVVRAAGSRPALELDAATVASIARNPEAFAYRRVRVHGTVPAATEFLLRGRSHMGQPGVHLFAPLHLREGEGVVLINRGWLHTPDAATVDPRPYAEPEARTVGGVVLPFPDASGAGRPIDIDLGDFRVFSLGRMDRTAVEARFASDILPFYSQQLPGAARAEPPVRLDLPALDRGPHLGYAVQWFGFAAVFLLGFTLVVVRRSV